AALSSRDRYLFKVDGTLERLFIACLGEATERQPGFLNILKANVLEILTRIARLLPAENAEARVSVPIRQRVDDRRAQQIAEYVERGACHNLTVADMARLMNLSEKQIQRIVSKRFGTSVHRMVMEAKLRAAKEMLKSPQYTLEQIATALGFASEQYFNRFFRRMEGMPPHRYRKSIIP
ncbi:MAG: helix-turn-helix transcriptional regulator, partial [Clostridiales bacterium]|nr:helix-turn-helix transcriptional regulator [Clostridiales bacterium]